MGIRRTSISPHLCTNVTNSIVYGPFGFATLGTPLSESNFDADSGPSRLGESPPETAWGGRGKNKKPVQSGRLATLPAMPINARGSLKENYLSVFTD